MSGQIAALFGGLGRRTGAPNWVNLCWLQNGTLDRCLGTAEMVAEKGPEQWKFGLISAPLFDGHGRRIKAPNASQPTLTAFMRPCSATKGADLARFWFFNQNDLISLWHYIYESMILGHIWLSSFSDQTLRQFSREKFLQRTHLSTLKSIPYFIIFCILSSMLT